MLRRRPLGRGRQGIFGSVVAALQVVDGDLLQRLVLPASLEAIGQVCNEISVDRGSQSPVPSDNAP